MPELSFLYAIHHLVLFYIFTTYHQNISKRFKLLSVQEVLRQHRHQGDLSQKQYVPPPKGGEGWGGGGIIHYKINIGCTLVKLMLHLHPHPTSPCPTKWCLFQVEEINIGISSKAHAHEKLWSKGTHSLYTFIKSEVRKWQIKVEKVTKIYLKMISKPHAHLQTLEKTCPKLQRHRYKIVWGVAITRYTLSIYLRSENDKVHKVEKSDKN